MKKSITLAFFILSYFLPAYGQETFRVIWYNVENLFDTYKHPVNDDGEFTPEGNRRWHPKRYRHKLQQISKALIAAGEWEIPALIGLCEIENEQVIRDLLFDTPLSRQKYHYCMGESQDSRGIRTTLLYQKERYQFLGHAHLSVSNPEKGYRKTRDILHTWGRIETGDTLDVFLTHFPSRYGGELESKKRRLYAARQLRKACDSILRVRQTPLILMMGDFNDTPRDESIHTLVQNPEGKGAPPLLIHLIPSSSHKEVKGTHKYQGNWSQLDHIIVNRTLLCNPQKIELKKGSIHIFSPPFLLTEDKTWRGVRPFRSFHGYTYEAGYSDHLPLIAEFLVYLSTIPDLK